MTIRAERSARWLDVVVHDDGRGLPEGFSLEKADRLGLQIVRTLVSAELDGSLGMHAVAHRWHRRGAAGADRQARAAGAVVRPITQLTIGRAQLGQIAIAHSYGPDISSGPYPVRSR